MEYLRIKISNKTVIIFLLFLIIPPSYMHSQVTIGITEPPVDGAILQIKDQEADGNNITATKGGLMLPQVELEDLTSLSPLVNISSIQSSEEKIRVQKRHTGLIVYNTKVITSKSLNEGIYYWDGQKWLNLYAGHVHSSPWYKVGTTESSKLNTDLSYLNAQVVINKNGVSDKNKPASTTSVEGGVQEAQLTVYDSDALINDIQIGRGAGKVLTNTSFGYNSLRVNNNSASNNTAIGAQALSANITGINNTALGYKSLTTLTSGSNNISVGNNTGTNLTDGVNNILLGYGVQATSSSANDEVNIANVIYGDIAKQQLAIGGKPTNIATIANQAAFYVDGKMNFKGRKIEGTEGNILRVSNNVGENADRIIRKSKIAPRRVAFLASKATQSVSSSSIENSKVYITWTDQDIVKNTDILETTIEDGNILTINREGLYEISGLVSYNPYTNFTSISGSSIPQNHDWLAGLILEIEYKDPGAEWVKLTNSITLWSASALRRAKEIQVPPMAVNLKVGSKIRMVIYKPTRSAGRFGLVHTSPSISAPEGTTSWNTKSLKIINL